MIVKILGEPHTPAYYAARATIKRLGHAIHDPEYVRCDLAVAPLLMAKIPEKDLLEPKFGTLIFHPSPLPYGRGASSIRWAYRRKEPITSATWFWANGKLDAGDICEAEIIKIDYELSPRQFYAVHVLPALERTLERCLMAIEKGFIHRVPQLERYSTYDGII